MEPNKIPNPDIEKLTMDDLHDEGVDVVAGSGTSLDNEFSGGEIAPEDSPKSTETSIAPTTTVSAEQPAPSASPKPTPTTDLPSIVPLNSVNPILDTDGVKNDPSIKQLRTFKSDAEEAVRYQNVSKVDIAVAEQKKRETRTSIEYVKERRSHPGRFIAIVLATIIVLGGGWYYWFASSPKEGISDKTPAAAIQTIIPYTKGSKIVLDAQSDPLTLIGTKLSAANAGLGNIYALVPVLYATSTIAAPLGNVLSKTTIPSRLIRSLGSEYMFGSYTYDTNGAFIILKSTFFQNAFAGMLDWEKDLRSDLIQLIHVSYPGEAGSAGTENKFEDMVISNIDARVLKGSEGQIILAYAFADNNTIVIATNINALKFVLDRLLTVRTIQ